MPRSGAGLAPAGREGAALKLCVSSDSSQATIRLHREGDDPGRVSGTELANPDFAAWARAFGAEGIVVERDSDIEAAVEAALAAEGSVVVDVRSSLEAISAYTTLAKLRGGR